MLFEMSYLLHSISLNEVKIRSNKFVSYLSNEVQKERKQEKKTIQTRKRLHRVCSPSHVGLHRNICRTCTWVYSYSASTLLTLPQWICVVRNRHIYITHITDLSSYMCIYFNCLIPSSFAFLL